MKFAPTKLALSLSVIAAAVLTGCGGSSSGDNGSDSLVVPTDYEFYDANGESTVSYSGQTFRIVLLEDLIDQGVAGADFDDDIDEALSTYFDFDSATNGANNYGFALSSSNPTAASVTLVPSPTYNDISSGKTLAEKIAGNDKVAHLQYDTIIGYPGDLADGEAVYDDLVSRFQMHLDSIPAPTITTANGEEALPATVNDEGVDFAQLIEKFLRGAIAFNQGTADYLSTDWTAAGNNDVLDGKTYTNNEHKWDEGFGYFGASRFYGSFTDDEIAGKATTSEKNVFWDHNADTEIDLGSEYNLGHAVNCGKRDRGSNGVTDYSKVAFDAFLTGRAILNAYALRGGDLTSAEVAEVEEQAEIAAQAWEACIAATAVHYINDVVADYEAIGATNLFDDLAAYTTFAKHWSELYGFALILQFSPYSPFAHPSVSYE
ncbi:MAG: DUF4856 domain-containing protein, partial [Pseudomonadota bacterium]|nr:DUF4856 domain-containing protein [Pseudomonadota bacterium]